MSLLSVLAALVISSQVQAQGVDQKKCDDLAKKLRPKAQACLNQKDFAKRKECFDKAGDSMKVGEEMWQGCRGVLDPMKNEFIAKEKAKYPNQPSALADNGGNKGPSPGQPGQPGQPNQPGQPGQPGQPNQMGGSQGQQMPPQSGTMAPPMKIDEKVCQDLGKKIRPLADKCLAIKDEGKRRECFDKMGDSLKQPEAVWQGCRGVLDPLKNEYMAKEKSMYPNQGSAVDGNKDKGNQGGPQGPNTGNKWSPEACAKEIPRLKKGGEACLPISKEDARRACFDKLGNSMPQDFWESCRGALEPLKAELQAKEKAKYPKQGSGLDGGGNGNQGSGPQQPGQPGQMNPPQTGSNQKPPPQVNCAKAVSEAKAAAKKCLAIKQADKRKVCFDQIGDKLHQSGASEACRDQLDPLKNEILSEEKAKYPNDAPSIN